MPEKQLPLRVAKHPGAMHALPASPGLAAARVLVVDDNADVRDLVAIHLRAQGHEVIEARDGAEALRATWAEKPDLVLLDVKMPGLDGYAVCREITARGSVAPPVIFLTAQADVSARVSGLDAGATDYVVKPFAGEELLARVRTALRTKAMTDALSVAAATDPLTGLLNRRELDVRAAEAIALANRGGALTCLMIDVDDFKRVNDTIGHQAGDDVLRQVALALRNATRVSDVVGRHGGDEFVVLLTGRELEAKQGARRIRGAFAGRELDVSAPATPPNERRPRVGISMGVATWQAGMETAADLYAAADHALYGAKRRGGRRVAGGSDAGAPHAHASLA